MLTILAVCVTVDVLAVADEDFRTVLVAMENKGKHIFIIITLAYVLIFCRRTNSVTCLINAYCMSYMCLYNIMLTVNCTSLCS